MIVRSINSCAATASKPPRSNVLEALGEAAYTRDRVSYLRRANLGIESSGSSFAMQPISTISTGASWKLN